MQMKTVGGDIHQAPIFQHIKSIGFEIETTDLIKFTIEPVKSKKSKSKTQKSKSKKSKSKTRRIEKKHRLINSALTNIDLENHTSIYVDLVYYCTNTATSIGFSNMLPINQNAKMITSLLSLAGQFYLVIIMMN
jgi:hypothetical protein